MTDSFTVSCYQLFRSSFSRVSTRPFLLAGPLPSVRVGVGDHLASPHIPFFVLFYSLWVLPPLFPMIDPFDCAFPVPLSPPPSLLHGVPYHINLPSLLGPLFNSEFLSADRAGGFFGRSVYPLTHVCFAPPRPGNLFLPTLSTLFSFAFTFSPRSLPAPR